jgi:hypothetical protein
MPVSRVGLPLNVETVDVRVGARTVHLTKTTIPRDRLTRGPLGPYSALSQTNFFVRQVFDKAESPRSAGVTA